MVQKDFSMNGEVLTLDEFDLLTMYDPDNGFYPTIAMIGKRGSGKSWIIRDIIRAYSHIPVGTVISPTDKKSGFFKNFFPDLYIYYEYETKILEKVMLRQETMIEKTKEKALEGKFVDPASFLIMDDCLASKGEWIKDTLIREVFQNGRHDKLLYILTMQYPLGIGPELRTNFDYVFIMGEDFTSIQKKICEQYVGMLKTFNDFKTVFEQVTENYGCLVVNNKVKSKDIRKKLFWYRADMKRCKEPFMFGCKQFKDFHKENYDKNWRKKPILFNIDNVMKGKKKQTKIIVNMEKHKDFED